MKSVLALLAVIAILLVAVEAKPRSIKDKIHAAAPVAGKDASVAQWEQFKRHHRRHYATKAHEQYRFKIFKSNMAKAKELSSKNPRAVFGANKFADLHPREFAQKYLTLRPVFGEALLKEKARSVIVPEELEDALPTNFDWRNPGDGRPVGVTPVKDQGQCGSCWAFSTTETIESAMLLEGDAQTILAPQQIVDCDTGDAGCNGGWPSTAYEYVQSAGLELETNYPYTSGTSGAAGTCAYNKTDMVSGTQVANWSYTIPMCEQDSCNTVNEALLAQNLYQYGPASICVDAEPWQTYVSGILDGSSGCTNGYSGLDHAVQLVGYGVDTTVNPPTKYWSIRNSWASSWGENGYIRVLYGNNTCGLGDVVTQVTLQ